MTALTYNAFPREPSVSPYLPMDSAEGRKRDAPQKDVEDTAVYMVQFAGQPGAATAAEPRSSPSGSMPALPKGR